MALTPITSWIKPQNEQFTLVKDASQTFSVQELVGDDEGLNGALLQLKSVGQPSHGTLSLLPNGRYVYQPTPGYTGSDSFNYTVTDQNGNLCTETVFITVQPLAVVGKVEILSDTNHDGVINAAEATSARADIRITLPSTAQAGDTLTLSDQNNARVALVLTAQDIASGSLTVPGAFALPSSGQTLTVKAQLSNHLEQVTSLGSAQAHVDTQATLAPHFSVLTDDNQDGKLSSAELRAHGGLDLRIDLPPGTQAGDVLTLTDPAGHRWTRALTADDVNAHQVVVLNAFPVPSDASSLAISAQITDTAGNASPVFTCAIPLPGPQPTLPPPVITDVMDNVGMQQGRVVSGGSTDDATPAFKGTSAPGTVVTVYDNGLKIGQTVTAGDWTWSFTPAADLRTGSHVFTVVASWPDGSAATPAPNGYTLLIGSQPTPLPPVITGVIDDVGTLQGHLGQGSVTDDTTPTVTGTSQPGTRVTLYDNGVKVGEAVTGPDWTWSVTPATPLAYGTHDFTVVSTFADGSASTPSAGAFRCTVDAARPAPLPPVITEVQDDVGASQGKVDSGGNTDDTTPTVKGTSQPGTVVTLYDHGVKIGDAVTGPDWGWSITPSTALSQGSHAFTVVAAYPDGLGSTPSPNTYNCTIGSASPALLPPVITGVIDNVGAQQGPVAQGGSTDDTTPTLKGTSQPGTRVEIYDNGIKVGEVLTAADWTWSFTPNQPLPSGAHTFTAVASLPDGTGQVASPGGYGCTLTSPTPPDSHSTGLVLDPLTADNSLSDAEALGNIAVTGHATGDFTPGDTVTLVVNGKNFTGTTGADGRFSINVPGSDLAADPDATLQASLKATNAAGMTGVITAQHTYLDATTQAPSSTGGSITGQEDTARVLSWHEFKVTDADSALKDLSIKITQLPADGRLEHYNGTAWVAVTANQSVSANDISAGHLRFVPDTNESGNAGFSTAGVGNLKSDYAQLKYTVSDGGHTSDVATMAIDIQGVADGARMSMSLGSVATTVVGGKRYDLKITTQLIDTDGSETLGNSVRLVLDNSTVKLQSAAGVDLARDADGGYTVAPSSLVGLKVLVPTGQSLGKVSLYQSTTEIGGDSRTDSVTLDGNTSVDNIQGGTAQGGLTGQEDTALTLTWASFHLQNSYGTNAKLTISSLPADGKLQFLKGSAWCDVTVGQTLTKADIDASKLRFMPDANEAGFDGYKTSGVGNKLSDYAQFKYTATDALGQNGQSGWFDIDIKPIADLGNLSVTMTGTKVPSGPAGLIKSDKLGNWWEYKFGVSGSSPDTDGSETRWVCISKMSNANGGIPKLYDDQGHLLKPDGSGAYWVKTTDTVYVDNPGYTTTITYQLGVREVNSQGDVLHQATTCAKTVSMTSPLVLDLNGDGVHTTAVDHGVQFDLNADGKPEQVGWSSKQDGLLVLDRNHDGLINDGRELFGEATRLANGNTAQDGFQALKELDSNHDGRITATDTQFQQLQVWTDTNQDGVTQHGELHGLSELGIAALNLSATTGSVMDHGNLLGLVSSYTTQDGHTHEMADVWFATQTQADTTAAASTLPAGLAAHLEGDGPSLDGLLTHAGLSAQAPTPPAQGNGFSAESAHLTSSVPVNPTIPHQPEWSH